MEGEFHFALECQHYHSIRNNTHDILKKTFQTNIQTESKRNLMSNFMSTDDREELCVYSFINVLPGRLI